MTGSDEQGRAAIPNLQESHGDVYAWRVVRCVFPPAKNHRCWRHTAGCSWPGQPPQELRLTQHAVFHIAGRTLLPINAAGTARPHLRQHVVPHEASVDVPGHRLALYYPSTQQAQRGHTHLRQHVVAHDANVDVPGHQLPHHICGALEPHLQAWELRDGGHVLPRVGLVHTQLAVLQRQEAEAAASF